VIQPVIGAIALEISARRKHGTVVSFVNGSCSSRALAATLRSCKVPATTSSIPLLLRSGGGFVGDFLGGIIDKGRPVQSHHCHFDLPGSGEAGEFPGHPGRVGVGSQIIELLKGRTLQDPARLTTP
jgi:hypothetical protein